MAIGEYQGKVMDMKGKKDLKHKISVDLREENVEALKEYKDALMREARMRKTTTQTINECVSLLLDTSDNFKKDLAKICLQKLQNTLPTNFHEEDRTCELRKWQDLYYFLTNERGLAENEKELKRIDFQNGYIIVPSDWIFINPNEIENKSYLYPHIIEFRNGEKYNLPHFFLLAKSAQLKSYQKDNFLELACEKYPPLKEFTPLAVHGINENGKALNCEVWEKWPEPDFFPFPKVRGYRKSIMGESWIPKSLLEELNAD
ncbi:hypothetical protein AALA24_12660 [Anaerovoracaceae bacterium 42-11]